MLGVDLKPQFSGWAPEKMIEQFKEALAARPNCIAIMGHPGSTAFHDLVKQAVSEGIVVTDGNAPLTELQRSSDRMASAMRASTFMLAPLTAKAMLADGLKAGDEAVVWGILSQAERGISEKGLAETLEKAGLKVDRLEIPDDVNSDASLGIPQFVAYIQSHPQLKAIGLQHGASPASCPTRLRRPARNPVHHRGRYRSRSGDDRRAQIRLHQRDPRPVALYAGLLSGHTMRDEREIQDAGPVA